MYDMTLAVSRFLLFFNHTSTTHIYTLSLHDALPISESALTPGSHEQAAPWCAPDTALGRRQHRDRKSTRLNSSHTVISYAVFCLKKKKHDLNDPCRRTYDRNTHGMCHRDGNQAHRLE